MIRVSATTLEAFRRLVATDYGSPRELEDSIKGVPWKPSWQMEAGTAWHAVLADPLGTYRQDCDQGEPDPWHQAEGSDYTFDPGAVREALRHIGPGVHEVKATALVNAWHLGGIEALVVAQADHILGNLIQDNKTKFTTPNARDYEHSLQWRVYLMCHGAVCFRYNLFAFSDPKDGYCRLNDIVSFRFWSYPGLEGDVRGWLRRFLDWADSRNLLPYLVRESSTPVLEAA